jgi:hypothetical protein
MKKAEECRVVDERKDDRTWTSLVHEERRKNLRVKEVGKNASDVTS